MGKTTLIEVESMLLKGGNCEVSVAIGSDKHAARSGGGAGGGRLYAGLGAGLLRTIFANGLAMIVYDEARWYNNT